MPRLIDADAFAEVMMRGIEEEYALDEEVKTVLFFLDCYADTVDPAPQWIPVTERLPDERTTVLDCCKNGKVGTNSWMGRTWQYENEKNPVTHWMPLPKPPEDGGTE